MKERESRERKRNKGLMKRGEIKSARWMHRLRGRNGRMGWRD